MGLFSYASIVVWLMATNRPCMMMNASKASANAAVNTNAINAVTRGRTSACEVEKKDIQGRISNPALQLGKKI